MSEQLTGFPEDINGLRDLFLDLRRKLAETWKGMPEEVLIQRPGPTSEWSVKDVITHICWWENYTIDRLAILSAGMEFMPVGDSDRLNEEVESIFSSIPLETVLAQFETNKQQLLNLIDHFSFEEWADETRPNFKGKAMMYFLAANTFAHYLDHLEELIKFRQKYLPYNP